LVGLSVTRCVVDFSFGIEFVADEELFKITIEQPFQVVLAGVSGLADLGV
jgi:hypothetical protein